MPELTLPALRVCLDKHLPPDLAARAADYAIRENPANRPYGADDPRKADPRTLAIQVGKKWKLPEDGSPLVLRVRFLGGNATIQQKIVAQVRQLEQWAHVRFEFVKTGTAEIRIGFDYQDGSWSYIGLDANFVPQNQKTMNFGWLYATTATSEYSSVVKHEFLHALGAIHEHQSPGAAINWDREKVYKAYGAPPNSWDRETIDSNVLDRYGPEGMSYTEFDPHSIMLYPVDPELTTDGFGTGWNTDLSARDREFLAQHYPRPAAPAPPPPPAPGPQPPPPPPDYPTLVVGAPPVFTEVGPGGSKVYRLTVQTAARYFVGVTRITGAGGLFVEVHKGSYPSSQRQVKPGAVTSVLQPGDFYVFVRPVDVARGMGRFALAVRRTGKS